MGDPQPVVLINAVGLTTALLALAPAGGALQRLAGRGLARPIAGTFPAVTLPAQASILTGQPPSRHGVVGNGWYRRELGEIRFWVQAAGQLDCEPIHLTAACRSRERGQKFTTASVFWWFAQGSGADWMVTPKPHYGADGSKAFDILTNPPALAADLTRALGEFPFPAFWGPMAGVASSEWIAQAACRILREQRPTFTTVYLPHLDYDLQRIGPGRLGNSGLQISVTALDGCIAAVMQAAEAAGALVLVVSEYGIAPVTRSALPNLALRRAKLLAVRDGPFGEVLDPTASAAFAVCDHQVAHVHTRDPESRRRALEALTGLAGVGEILTGEKLAATGLSHSRAGDIVLVSEPDAWFAYPYWENDEKAPDFARTVDIHRKPGYDPCELLFDPTLSSPKLKVAGKLLVRKLGFRALMDVIPLRPDLIGGSHGRLVTGDDGPLAILPANGPLSQVTSHFGFRDALLEHWGLSGE